MPLCRGVLCGANQAVRGDGSSGVSNISDISKFSKSHREATRAAVRGQWDAHANGRHAFVPEMDQAQLFTDRESFGPIVSSSTGPGSKTSANIDSMDSNGIPGASLPPVEEAFAVGSAAAVASNKTWLDKLPSDVAQKAVKYISGGKQSCSVVNLALTSETMRKAVINSLSNKLVVCSSRLHDDDTSYLKWLALEQDLSLDFRAVQRKPYDENALSMLKVRNQARMLTSFVSIYDDSWFLRAIHNCSISEIEIFLGESSLGEVVKALSSVSGLKRMTFLCSHMNPKLCNFNNLLEILQTDQARTFLGQIESINVFCCCYDDDDPLWAMMPFLTSLRQLVLYKAPPNDHLMAQLLDLESVRLLEVKLSLPILAKIGGSVVDLHLPGDIHNGAQVSLLKDCTNLRKLVLEIKPGTEVALSKLEHMLKGLRVLHLMWDEAIKDPSDVPDPFYGSLKYHASVPGSILSLVQKAEALEVLRLEFVRIEMSELEKVLQILGPRLKGLSTSIASQGSCPLHWLDGLLECVIENNSGLEYWNVVEKLPNITAANMETCMPLAKHMQNGLKVLKRLSPRLEAGKIADIVASMMRAVQAAALEESGVAA